MHIGPWGSSDAVECRRLVVFDKHEVLVSARLGGLTGKWKHLRYDRKHELSRRTDGQASQESVPFSILAEEIDLDDDEEEHPTRNTVRRSSSIRSTVTPSY